MKQLSPLRAQTSNAAAIEKGPSARGGFRKFFFIVSGFLLVLSLVFLSLPEERIKKELESTLSKVLVDSGFSLAFKESDLRLFFGMHYSMRDVTVSGFSWGMLHLDEVSVRPSLLRLAMHRLAGDLSLRTTDGSVEASFSHSPMNFDLDFRANAFDLGQVLMREPGVPVGVAGLLNGSGIISNVPRNAATTHGKVDLEMSRLVIDLQSIRGVPVPRLSISEAKFDVSFEKGRIELDTFRIGNVDRASDDIVANLIGSVHMIKQVEQSELDLIARFKFSESVLNSFLAVDRILRPGKQADGTYEFQISGTLAKPRAF
ncbi:MAG: type II secretion system protein GspN [Bdellovibrionales bacterium GWB1_55_8]|nr:MAG: type II secretion system protein GspN [Bdellovibrionales bacterium GWB1_55_8]